MTADVFANSDNVNANSEKPYDRQPRLARNFRYHRSAKKIEQQRQRILALENPGHRLDIHRVQSEQ